MCARWTCKKSGPACRPRATLTSQLSRYEFPPPGSTGAAHVLCRSGRLAWIHRAAVDPHNYRNVCLPFVFPCPGSSCLRAAALKGQSLSPRVPLTPRGGVPWMQKFPRSKEGQSPRFLLTSAVGVRQGAERKGPLLTGNPLDSFGA